MDNIDYKDLMLRVEKFYNYPQTNDPEHKFRIKFAEEIIKGWIKRELMKKLGNPKNVYELMIQLDLRGY